MSKSIIFSAFVLALVLATGFILVSSDSAEAVPVECQVIIDDSDGMCAGFGMYGQQLFLGDGQCTEAGKSGNINCTCHAYNPELLHPDSAVVRDDVVCCIRGVAPYDIPVFDGHVVVTPSGNVNAHCQLHRNNGAGPVECR